MVHCDDHLRKCAKKPGGKSVGGYAWTDFDHFWNNYHVNFCSPFFSAEPLSDKIKWLAKEEAQSEADYRRYASDANWLRSRGSLFMHELFHLWFVDKATDVSDSSHTHITDMHTRNSWTDSNKVSNIRAYDPEAVRKLATNGPEKGGGAAWAMLNADSYTQAINAVYWYKRNGILPQQPGENYYGLNFTNASSSSAPAPPEPIIFVQLGNMTGNYGFSAAFDTAAATWNYQT